MIPTTFLVIAAFGSGVFVSGAMAWMDRRHWTKKWRSLIDDWRQICATWEAAFDTESEKVSDQMLALTSIIALETPHANATVRRMAAVARDALGVETQVRVKESAEVST